MIKTDRPLILISNDDGYQSKGLHALIDMVEAMADVVVCAPDGPRSGMSCAFSANVPLTIERHADYHNAQIWSCNGTPVDCVKIALDQIVNRTPDMVIGGINHGDNASVNTHYSGTMGVTLEGCMKYIPSVAFSLCDHRADADFSPLAPYIEHITRQVLQKGLPPGVCLNVNFPLSENGRFRGVRVCRMARGRWINELVSCHHPRGYDYHWMVGEYVNDEPDVDDTDNWSLRHGYVAVTPTRIDVTAYDHMEQIKALINQDKKEP